MRLLILTGTSGSGKTAIAEAIGNARPRLARTSIGSASRKEGRSWLQNRRESGQCRIKPDFYHMQTVVLRMASISPHPRQDGPAIVAGDAAGAASRRGPASLKEKRALVGAVTFCRNILMAFVVTIADALAQTQTALDRYVAAPDPHYRYQLVSTTPGDGYTGYVLAMTSQQWRSAQEVDHPVWRHWVTIVRPDHVAARTGLLLISGGSNEKPPPRHISPILIRLARATQSVIAEVRMVPNQPLVFADDHQKRTEDAITAYSWQKFLITSDETWPIRLPMTKSVVRAMDTVAAFCASSAGGRIIVDKFVLAGASKRGWAAWTTAAVDHRVVAIVPAVIDLLNIETSFEHQYRSYGFWAPAINEFEQTGIMRWAHTPRLAALLRIEDPYSYRDRLTMPKFIVNSAGDQYFLPDSSRFYFDHLKGEKYLLYMANTDHSLRGAEFDTAESALAFYESVLTNATRPRFAWNFQDDGSIRAKTLTKPLAVTLWQASNPGARDFRLETIGRAYTSSDLTDQGDGDYIGRVPQPKHGWTAFFVEMTFPNPGSHPFKFTTGVRIVPDRLPFGPPPVEEGTTLPQPVDVR
jgi:PhoPQ-activated pathogenicity-related protein